MRHNHSVLFALAAIYFAFSPATNAGIFDDIKKAAKNVTKIVDDVNETMNPEQAQDQEQAPNLQPSNQPNQTQSEPVKQAASNSESSPSYSPALVEHIQEGLNELGYNAGTPDGIYGTGTRKAIQAFEVKQGLAVTGEPTEAVWAAINKAKAAGSSGSVAAASQTTASSPQQSSSAGPATASITSADRKPLSYPQWGQAVGQGTAPTVQGPGCGIACLDAVEVLCGNPRNSAWKQEALDRANSDFTALPAPKSGMNTAPMKGQSSSYSAAQIAGFVKYVNDNYDKSYDATLQQGNKAVLCEPDYLDQFLDEKDQSVTMAIASGHSKYLARFAAKGSQVAANSGAGGKISGATKVPSDAAPAPLLPYHAFLMGTRDGALKRDANTYEKLTEALVQQNLSQLGQLKKNQHNPWNCPDLPESPRVDLIPVFWDQGPSNDILARLLMTDEPDPKWVAALMPRIEKCRALAGAAANNKSGYVPTRINLNFYMFSADEIEGRNATFVAKQYSSRVKQSVDLAIPFLPARYQLWGGAGLRLKYDFNSQQAVFRNPKGEETSVQLLPLAAEHPQLKDIQQKVSGVPQLAAALKGRHLYSPAFRQPAKPQKKYSNQPEPVTVVPGIMTIGSWRESMGSHTLRAAAEAMGGARFVLALNKRLQLDRIPMGLTAAEAVFDGDNIGNMTSEVVIRNVKAVSPPLTLYAHQPTSTQEAMAVKAIILTADVESVKLKKTHDNNVIADMGVLQESMLAFAKGQSAVQAAEASAQAAAAAETEKKAEAEAARLSSLDVVGLKLGMSLAEADKIVRKHMTPTSEYKFERSKELEPFDRSVLYVNYDKRLEDAPDIESCVEVLKDPRMPEEYKKQTRERCDKQKELQFWAGTRPKEVISLAVEKSPAGSDVVVGISRWLGLAQGTDKKSVVASLQNKYGSPAVARDEDHRFTASWGKVNRSNSSTCSPRAERHMKEGQWKAGDKLPERAFVWHVQASIHVQAMTFSHESYKKQLEQCGPVVAAKFTDDPSSDRDKPSKTSLSVVLADYKGYKQTFASLVESGADQEKAAVDLAL